MYARNIWCVCAVSRISKVPSTCPEVNTTQCYVRSPSVSSFHIPLQTPPAGLNFVFIILLFFFNELLNFAYLNISCKWNSSVFNFLFPTWYLRCAAGSHWHCGQIGVWVPHLTFLGAVCVHAVLQGICLEDRSARVMFTGPWTVLQSTCISSHPTIVMPASVTLHPDYIIIIETALFYR